MLVDTTKRQAALKEVAPELRDPLITSVRVQKADFDFVQLQEWKHLAISDSAVVSSDADEVRNRVVVGVVDSASVIPTRRRLLQMGIPDEALVLEVTGPSEWLDHRHGAPPNQRMKLSGRGGRPL